MFNFIFTADKASKKPLYEQLYSYVADEIKNKNIKENISIILLLYFLGAISGILIELINLIVFFQILSILM